MEVVALDVVVQRIRTSWTKQSRGGAGARLRNAVPLGFVLPSVRPLSADQQQVGQRFVHDVEMDEYDGFLPRFRAIAELPDEEELLVEEDGDRLRVLVEAAPYGMPRRWQRPPALGLAAGQWMRWQVNYRFESFRRGDWMYRLDTYNVAFGPVDARTFLGTPTRSVDERGRLR